MRMIGIFGAAEKSRGLASQTQRTTKTPLHAGAQQNKRQDRRGARCAAAMTKIRCGRGGRGRNSEGKRGWSCQTTNVGSEPGRLLRRQQKASSVSATRRSA